MNTAPISGSNNRQLSSQRCPVTNALQPNRVRNFEGFHISYNPHRADYGCDTTALVLQGRVFFVLNGDHAADLLDAAEQGGLQSCVDLFIARIERANAISEHRMAVGAAVALAGVLIIAMRPNQIMLLLFNLRSRPR